MNNTYALYATTTPQLEPVLAAELTALGATAVRADHGGVAFRGDMMLVYRANLWLRSANRVLLRLAHFKANAMWGLHKQAAQLPWGNHIAPGTPLLFKITSSKSKLYHTGGIAQRLVKGMREQLGAKSQYFLNERDASDDAQRIIVRVVKDWFTISLDTSGDLLYRRGYRLALAKAPLRETIAAGLLLTLGYDGQQPLIDPFCGSGTFAIEAALIARRIAPGRRNVPVCLDWPTAQPDRWQALLDEAEAHVLPSAAAPIVGSDRDAGAIAAARENAELAGVTADIQWHVRAFSDAAPPSETPGVWVSNLPYGKRTASHDQRNLFAQLGKVARAHYEGWRLACLTTPNAPFRHSGLDFATMFTLDNGGTLARFIDTIVPGRN